MEQRAEGLEIEERSEKKMTFIVGGIVQSCSH